MTLRRNRLSCRADWKGRVAGIIQRIRAGELGANLGRLRRMRLSEPQVREWLVRWGFRLGFVLLGVLTIYQLARG